MVNGGMDTQAVLREFPTQLRGDVLMAIYAPLLETSTAFLRCPDPLRRHMLTLVRPVVALKKETVVSGGQYNSLLYILLKGSLQVTMAAGFADGADDRRTGTRRAASTPSPAKFKRSATAVTAAPAAVFTPPHLTTSTSPPSTSPILPIPPDSVVEGEDADADAREPRRRHPPADVYAGPRPSPFNVFATSQCYIFQVDCVELARVLDQYSEEESEQVTTALEKEHKALCDSLKSRRTTVGGGGEGDGGTPSPDMARARADGEGGGRGGKGHTRSSLHSTRAATPLSRRSSRGWRRRRSASSAPSSR